MVIWFGIVLFSLYRAGAPGGAGAHAPCHSKKSLAGVNNPPDYSPYH
jgi:hypothetical protein